VTVLSVGPTATVLANRLAARGIQALDLGSAGGFLLRLLTGAGAAELTSAERARAMGIEPGG
jgi:hypothetical protein